MTDDVVECFRILELKQDASAEEVKQAYREMAKVWHPDRFSDDPVLQSKARERLSKIDGAYDRLQNYFRQHGVRDAPGQADAKGHRDGDETGVGDTPPPIHSPPHLRATVDTPSGEEKKANLGVRIFWAVVVAVGIIVVLIIVGSGGGSVNSIPSYGVPVGGARVARDGNYAPVPAYVPPISKALDEKNGFKDFRFGMTPSEVRTIMEPSSVTRQPGANEEVFHYIGTAANRIGEFPTDSLALRFFEGRLFRIDIRLSNFQSEIFEALKINYGEAVDNSTWTRGDEPLTAKSWHGEKVDAAILAPRGLAWDYLVIFDKASNQSAQEYATKEPERAAKDFSSVGFKQLSMGMRLEDLTTAYTVAEDNQITGVKKVVFRTGDWLALGFYPLRYVAAEFFKGRLYRIDLSFEENRKDIFKTFQHRFDPLQDNDTWTRGNEKLTAKSGGNEKLYGTILAVSGAVGSEQWDAIVILDLGIQREAEKFKQDAPKRAAKDL